MKGYTMNDYEDGLSIAMREIEETKENKRQIHLSRLRKHRGHIDT